MKNNISDFRKRQSLTQKALAEKMNVAESVIQRWEHQRNIPTLETAIKLARVLNTTVEELFIVDDND